MGERLSLTPRALQRHGGDAVAVPVRHLIRARQIELRRAAPRPGLVPYGAGGEPGSPARRRGILMRHVRTPLRKRQHPVQSVSALPDASRFTRSVRLLRRFCCTRRPCGIEARRCLVQPLVGSADNPPARWRGAASGPRRGPCRARPAGCPRPRAARGRTRPRRRSRSACAEPRSSVGGTRLGKLTTSRIRPVLQGIVLGNVGEQTATGAASSGNRRPLPSV